MLIMQKNSSLDNVVIIVLEHASKDNDKHLEY